MAINEKDRRTEQLVGAGLPFTRFQYVEATFGDANLDLLIAHDLDPADPDVLQYSVVQADRATQVYHDQSVTRRAWASDYILLRSSVADAKVRLLLTLPAES